MRELTEETIVKLSDVPVSQPEPYSSPANTGDKTMPRRLDRRKELDESEDDLGRTVRRGVGGEEADFDSPR